MNFLMKLEDLTNYKLSKSQSDQKAKSQDGKVWDCVSLAKKFGGRDKNATTFDEYKVAKSFIAELTNALKTNNQNDVLITYQQLHILSASSYILLDS